jgi:5'-deoxynucleotidase YfbR-like HD superfamily hydrolase
MMSEYTEAKLYRDAGAVKRFHVLRTHRAQSVAEHSFGMLMLLKQVMEAGFWTTRDQLETYHRVMHHDLPEFYTGDIPGPIKRAHPALGPLLDEIEEDLAPLYRPEDTDTVMHGEITALVKWADRMEGALWAMEELRMGNLNMRPVVERYLGWMTAARIPDCANALTKEVVQIVVDEFGILPATGATLEMKS